MQTQISLADDVDTLPDMYVGVTAATILILEVLTFLPVLVLGPVAEAFQLATGR